MITNYLGIIPRNLIKNKKRTVSIAISIILTTVLLTSVEMLVRSVVSTNVKVIQDISGKYYGCYLKVLQLGKNIIMKDDRIDMVGITTFLGYSKTDKYSVTLNGMDEKSIDMLSMKLIEGHYPKEQGEVVVEDQVLKTVFPNKKVGEKIILNVEIESYDRETHKNVKNIKKLQFTICGVISDLRGVFGVGDGAIFLDQNIAEALVPSHAMIYNLYFTTKRELPVKNTIEWFNTKYENEFSRNYSINRQVIQTMDTYEKSKKIVILIDILIAIAAAVLIYNILSISIIERIKQFGLLRSIGITPNQIKVIVLGEGVLFAILLIPIGIILGINATTLMINLIGDINNINLIVDSNSYNIFTISTSVLVSIILASLKPAKTAAAVSPIEAMVISSKVKRKNEKNAGAIAKAIEYLIGYSWKIAYMNIKRNKNRFMATITSISMGIMIFLSVNYFINCMDPVNNAKLDNGANFTLKINVGPENIGYSNEQISHIESNVGINEIIKYKLIHGNTKLKNENMTVEGIKTVGSNSNAYVQELAQQGTYSMSAFVIGCSKEEMYRIRKESKINVNGISNLDSDMPKAFVIQEKGDEEFTIFKQGDIIKVIWTISDGTNKKELNVQFAVEAVINEIPFKLNRTGANLVLLTEEENLLKYYELKGYQVLSIFTSKSADEELIESVLKSIASQVKNGNLISYQQNIRESIKMKFQVTVVLYTLFLIVAVFALINTINTISINIITRKHEFGMLRAVGMTKSQLTKVIAKEGFMYGLAGSFVGAIFGIFLSYIIYKSGNGVIMDDMKWEIRYSVIILVTIITIITTSISTLVPLSKATNLNIIESIKAIE